ncbi:MAG TPA: hypothetical protein VFT19_00505 [Solirubrobacterales bacterium]|nr:hypothetical protein [Solirubrobacterales bacterium]
MIRRAAVVLALSAGLVLLAHPFAGAASDVWGNVGPASPLGSGGLPGRYPLSHYALDQHFEAISASLTGGVDASGVAPMIAYFLTSVLWALTSFLANLLIELFGFAFSLDLVRGSDATGGAGALGPVARAIHAIYANVFGGPWLALAVTVAGIWAMWKALVQRRYAETAGALALSLIYIVAALFFVFQPAQTIGAASQWANRMSVAFLSVADHGGTSGGAAARDAGARQLFDLLVFKPWVVLEFGGVEHCVAAGSGDEDSDPDSVAVRPLSADPGRAASLARRLRAGEEVGSGGKVCVNNAAKYAHRFLRFGPGTEERDAEYDALNHGDASRVAQGARGYRLGVADKPATDAMEEGGQYQRLLIAILVFVGELGAFCLLGALAVGVILAQVLLLLTLAFAPVALVAAAIPGRGHAFFKSWLEKLAGYLLRKVAYSLLLAILLAVNGALASATDSLGWLLSFGLQALFFWAVFLQRKALSESLIGIATGSGAPGREGAVRVLGLYYGARVAGRGLRGAGRAARSAAGAPGRALGRLNSRRAAPSTSPAGPAPLFGTSYSRQVGRGAPAAEPGRRSQSRERGRAGGERGERDERGEEPGSRREPLTEPAARAWDDAQRRERGDQSSAPERPRGSGSSKSADGRPARRARQAPPGPPEAPAENRKGDGESLDAELRAERERRRRDPRKPDAGKSAEEGGPRRPRRFSRLRRGRRKKRGR